MTVLLTSPERVVGVPFARRLAGHGERPALITRDGEVTYRELGMRVELAARRLGTGRRLVMLAAGNDVDAVVYYLAALAAGHAVLLTAADAAATQATLMAGYDPDVLVHKVGGRWQVEHRRRGSAHDLHPDLALLLSTSGSTGSPKLVRLSHDNVQANAESIAEYLGIRDTDRAATSLPIHYSYGLSVLNSHLLRGAALILTGLSVVDACFWELFRRHRGTALAGVPYTFDLLERVGFAEMGLPHLRYVTQAGGRLAPDRVRRYAELGARRGWDFYVMYGQTEATARMAYLPPDLAVLHPGAIGVPVPGGSFALEPLPDWTDPDTGELVYTGPNVMLGYAHSARDLRLGRTVERLRTGDVARRTAAGVYEIVGRRSRFLKIFGLRVDLQQVEAELAARGIGGCCVGDDAELMVAVGPGCDPAGVRRIAASAAGLPERVVRVGVLDEVPRTPSGKPDYAAIRRAVGEAQTAGPAGTDRTAGMAEIAGTDDIAGSTQRDGSPRVDAAALRRLYAEILGRSDVTDASSFVELGGDSLSYVELSLRLEQLLGRLPAGWHTVAIGELVPTTAAPPRRRRALDTSVALRAASIVLIVGSHIHLFTIRGGAHLLLALAGFNFARFHLTAAARSDRVRHLAASVGRIAVPSVLWIALVFLVTDEYDLANVFLLNEALGPRTGPERNFWFVETLVYLLLALVAGLSLPLLDRLERRRPFALPVALLGLALLLRYEIVPVSPWAHLSTPVLLFWLFALGWAGAKATGVRQRLVVTAAGVVSVVGFFGQPWREAVVVGGLLALLWLPSVPSVAVLNRLAGVLAGSSLYIYLVHWQVYPYLDDVSGVLALVASLVVGVLYAAAVTRATSVLRRWLVRCRPARRPMPAQCSTPRTGR